MRETRLKRSTRFMEWLLEGNASNKEPEGFYESEEAVQAQGHTHSWWKVMCLTGVDYFSTLGYQPSIAAVAAGALSPIATLILVLFTLFGALPMYNRVAAESPHGQGSISMLERLLPFWQGKLLVLALIGFAATGFIITITLSAADATAHLVENPFVANIIPEGVHLEVPITLILVALLGAVFLKGFSEAIGIAVGLVIVFIALNAVVVVRGLMEVLARPEVFEDWTSALAAQAGNPIAILVASLLVFPKLALGLSGFETGVVLMPQVKGKPGDTEANPVGRIQNARKLLTLAALIMSVMLITSSIVSTLLIPQREFVKEYISAGSTVLEDGTKISGGGLLPAGAIVAQDTPLENTILLRDQVLRRGEVVPAKGEANGRALAYLAHKYLGDLFGTLYDISTIFILWFAGASAMAGLLNIVPRYLPRYGMAPQWTTLTRPLVIVYTLICFAVTVGFKASVDAQGAAYATGVLALMGSAAVAVFLSALRHRERRQTVFYAFITAIFIYTLLINFVSDLSGLRIALLFIVLIVVVSLVSRVLRSTELRVESIELDEMARMLLAEEAKGHIRIIANRRNAGDVHEYDAKEAEVRFDTHIPLEDPILFLEVVVDDASDFTDVVEITGVQIGRHKILRARAASVPNAIAAILLYVRDRTSKIPHVYFGWTEGNPFLFAARFILFGEGDIAPVTREILRQAEHDPKRRPAVHVGG